MKMKTRISECSICGKKVVSRRSIDNTNIPLSYVNLKSKKIFCRECINDSKIL